MQERDFLFAMRARDDVAEAGRQKDSSSKQCILRPLKSLMFSPMKLITERPISF